MATDYPTNGIFHWLIEYLNLLERGCAGCHCHCMKGVGEYPSQIWSSWLFLQPMAFIRRAGLPGVPKNRGLVKSSVPKTLLPLPYRNTPTRLYAEHLKATATPMLLYCCNHLEPCWNKAPFSLPTSWFFRSRVRPENLHSQQVPGWICTVSHNFKTFLINAKTVLTVAATYVYMLDPWTRGPRPSVLPRPLIKSKLCFQLPFCLPLSYCVTMDD